MKIETLEKIKNEYNKYSLNEKYNNVLLLNTILNKYSSEINEKNSEKIYFKIGNPYDFLHEIMEGIKIDELKAFRDHKIKITNEQVYINIETNQIIYINLDDLDQIQTFEKNHNIVYMTDIYESKNVRLILECILPSIKCEFVLKAIETNQEEAKKYMLEKYSKKIQQQNMKEYHDKIISFRGEVLQHKIKKLNHII